MQICSEVVEILERFNPYIEEEEFLESLKPRIQERKTNVEQIKFICNALREQFTKEGTKDEKQELIDKDSEPIVNENQYYIDILDKIEEFINHENM